MQTGKNAKDVPSQDEVTNFGRDSSLLGTLKQTSQPSSSDGELLPIQPHRDYQVLSDASTAQMLYDARQA